MRVAVDTSAIIAVIADEPEKARLIELTKDGQVFVIRPETPAKKSPFEVRSIKLPITRMDILEAIHESRARYS